MIAPKTLRFVSSGAAPSPLPFGARLAPPDAPGADAWLVKPPSADPSAIVRALAALEPIPAGTILVLLPEAGTGGGILGVFGGAKVERASRCAALLAYGCAEIGGEVDPTSQLDLAWGSAPER